MPSKAVLHSSGCTSNSYVEVLHWYLWGTTHVWGLCKKFLKFIVNNFISRLSYAYPLKIISMNSNALHPSPFPLLIALFKGCVLNLSVGSEVFTLVVMKSTIFWDLTPCSPLKVSQHFGLPPAFTLVSLTQKMETVCSPEMSIDFQQTTQRYVPEGTTLQISLSSSVIFVMMSSTIWNLSFRVIFILGNIKRSEGNRLG
jgi:hypothetical protein